MDAPVTKSPTSVLDFSYNLPPTKREVPRAEEEDIENNDPSERRIWRSRKRCKSISSFRAPKRRLDFDDEVEEESSSGETTNSLNFRNRLVCKKTVQWLACSGAARNTDNSSSGKSSRKLRKLWLGPVFECPQTVLLAISTIPESIIHLDLDLRNALHLLPQVMPLLFKKTHIQTLSIRFFGNIGAIGGGTILGTFFGLIALGFLLRFSKLSANFVSRNLKNETSSEKSVFS